MWLNEVDASLDIVYSKRIRVRAGRHAEGSLSHKPISHYNDTLCYSDKLDGVGMMGEHTQAGASDGSHGLHKYSRFRAYYGDPQWMKGALPTAIHSQSLPPSEYFLPEGANAVSKHNTPVATCTRKRHAYQDNRTGCLAKCGGEAAFGVDTQSCLTPLPTQQCQWELQSGDGEMGQRVLHTCALTSMNGRRGETVDFSHNLTGTAFGYDDSYEERSKDYTNKMETGCMSCVDLTASPKDFQNNSRMHFPVAGPVCVSNAAGSLEGGNGGGGHYAYLSSQTGAPLSLSSQHEIMKGADDSSGLTENASAPAHTPLSTWGVTSFVSHAEGLHFIQPQDRSNEKNITTFVESHFSAASTYGNLAPFAKGVEPPFLPPQCGEHAGRLTCCLDLDDTLVHTFETAPPWWNSGENPLHLEILMDVSKHEDDDFQPSYNEDFGDAANEVCSTGFAPYTQAPGSCMCNSPQSSQNPLRETTKAKRLYVHLRPFADELVRSCLDMFEVVFFTAGTEEYAKHICDHFDPKRKAHRLYRQHCVPVSGVYMKDLSLLGRPIDRIILLDDRGPEVSFQPDKVIFCDPYLLDEMNCVKDQLETDEALRSFLNFLVVLSKLPVHLITKVLKEYQESVMKRVSTHVSEAESLPSVLQS
uniref:FCP1 homology domain-containing protein n=1 Tax=Trypanosoma congolense (strain IL3000) TaxID=1068625 RepID=G0UYG7_TRYCI|nr:conserved hypothetical protein [Trypanosoma congolense IL3000]